MKQPSRPLLPPCGPNYYCKIVRLEKSAYYAYVEIYGTYFGLQKAAAYVDSIKQGSLLDCETELLMLLLVGEFQRFVFSLQVFGSHWASSPWRGSQPSRRFPHTEPGLCGLHEELND